jgi:VWFA-related protein
MWRGALMAILVVTLGIPLNSRPMLAQQEGPQEPPSGQQEPPPPPPQNKGNPPPKQAPPSEPQSSISVQSNIVDVDAVVTDSEGDVVTGLKRENFRVFDNGEPQQITNFSPSDAQLTLVMLMEYSDAYWGYYEGYFGAKAQYWADGFLNHLKPQDWVALKTFDLGTTLQVDFTQDKSEVDRAIRTLGFPTFHEADLFDALYETLNQLRDVKGKKSILILATGFDTLSKHTLDQMLNRLKETEVTIFCVGMGEEIDLYSRGNDIGYIQAKNQLTTFAHMTGGYAFFPRFAGEMPEIFNSVADFLRNQYTFAFAPTTPQDGKYHKITVNVVDEQGNPLELVNRKGKKKKVQVVAREGYVAPGQPSAASN